MFRKKSNPRRQPVHMKPPRFIPNPKVFILSLAALALTSSALADATVDQLRCEYLANPLGIDAANPRLNWIIISNQRGERQVAYQILVASSPKLLSQGHGDLWDSGKV